MKPGAYYSKERTCRFTVWAPLLKKVALEVVYPGKRIVAMEKDRRGYWNAVVNGIAAGTRYLYRLDGSLRRPDPAAFFQPRGVHGPSEVVDHGSFHWEDARWRGMALQDMVVYELHVGAFTPQGTFQAVVGRLDELKKTGINAIEIMPVAQFPGDRNWGYDGVYPFAVQNSYGGPDALKGLVNACHKAGLAVILDVVYNHLGPEGNYLADFAPYFTDRYRTPWGKAVNFDDAYSSGVRDYFVENMLFWFEHYHFDALRLDAVHGIFDLSTKHILQELAERAERYSRGKGRKYYLIAESDLNDSRVIRRRSLGGFGIHAQWCDDFHHALHAALTGETSGYYQDYGNVGQLAVALRDGFVYTGQYSPYRKRNFGNSYQDILSSQIVVFSQNHDQVGNRAFGERLSRLVDFESLKLAACAVIFSPYVPLLFMGEEYAEEAPFLYFVSHGDEALIRAVRRGRKKEFPSFSWQKDPPDPQDKKTFLASKLQWELRKKERHKALREFYRELIKIRRQTAALANLSREDSGVCCEEDKGVIILQRWHSGSRVAAIMNFSRRGQSVDFSFLGGVWRKVIDSSEGQWRGNGSALPKRLERRHILEIKPRSCALYERQAKR